MSNLLSTDDELLWVTYHPLPTGSKNHREDGTEKTRVSEDREECSEMLWTHELRAALVTCTRASKIKPTKTVEGIGEDLTKSLS